MESSNRRGRSRSKSKRKSKKKRIKIRITIKIKITQSDGSWRSLRAMELDLHPDVLDRNYGSRT